MYSIKRDAYTSTIIHMWSLRSVEATPAEFVVTDNGRKIKIKNTHATHENPVRK